jgi:hypothetical protein
MLPLRCEEELVVRHLPEETLVYDRKRNQAHCLNRAAALVWQHCDGQTSVAKMAAILHHELNIPADERVVWLALDRLQKARLLRQGPVSGDVARYSRRDLARKLGLAAVAVPLVMTILAPTAAMAASCAHTGQPCGSTPCCAGCNCNPARHVCKGIC